MFEIKKGARNYLKCNEIIIKGMFKRRRLVALGVLELSDKPQKMYVVK